MARDAIALDLTAYDFDLAVLFLQNVGRIISRRHIQQAVWGLTTTLNSHTIDNHMSQMRIKLGLVPEYGWQLKSIFARGYRLDQFSLRRCFLCSRKAH